MGYAGVPSARLLNLTNKYGTSGIPKFMTASAGFISYRRFMEAAANIFKILFGDARSLFYKGQAMKDDIKMLK